jgi:uncharacterized protein YoxC
MGRIIIIARKYREKVFGEFTAISGITIGMFLMFNSILSCNSGGGFFGNGTDDYKRKLDSIAAAEGDLKSQNDAANLKIDQLATRNSQLDSDLKQKQDELEELHRKVADLHANNKALKSKDDKNRKIILTLQSDLGREQSAIERAPGFTDSSNGALYRLRDSLLSRYYHLLELGSVLHASGIRITAIHLKRHGKREKPTFRAGKADLLRVNFDIDENRIAESGVKQLFFVIKDPAGRLLTAPDKSMSNFTASNGVQIPYSFMREIKLKQNEKIAGLMVEWGHEYEYQRGTYTITIYNNGYKIGTARTILD